jgi:hypothetical protein
MRLKEIIVDDVKLRANVACTEVADKANGAGVQGRGTHVLVLVRSRLPCVPLSFIL